MSSVHPGFRQAAIWLAGIALAVLAASAAFGSVMQRAMPLVAMQAFPENGWASARAAELVARQAVLANGGQLPEQFPAQAIALARKGYASEPLAVEAPRILAFDLAARGDREAARRVMLLVPALSKRERGANIWLAEDYAMLGDEADAFRYFDLTLRTSASAKQALLPRMVGALASDAAIQPLAMLLGRDPPWSIDFWRLAVRDPARAPNVVKVRMAQDGPASDNGEIDRILLRNLVSARDFEGAAEFYHFLTRRRPSATFDDDFGAVPNAPPFDWDLREQGDLAADLAQAGGELSIRAVGGARGIAVRRLIPAREGRYRLVLAGREGDQQDFGVLRPSVRYACGGSIGVEGVELQAEQLEARWTISNPRCPYYWLELMTAVEPGGRPVSLSITSAQLGRLSESGRD